MQVFLASDVLLKSRYKPSLSDALDKEGINATLPTNASAHLRQGPQLAPAELRRRSDRRHPRVEAAAPRRACTATGSAASRWAASRSRPAPPRPYSSRATRRSTSRSRTRATAPRPTSVVTVTVGQGADATKLEETLPEIAPGETKNVTIPLTGQPPTGQNVPIKVDGQAGARRAGHGQQRGRLHGHLHPLSRLSTLAAWTT